MKKHTNYIHNIIHSLCTISSIYPIYSPKYPCTLKKLTQSGECWVFAVLDKFSSFLWHYHRFSFRTFQRHGELWQMEPGLHTPPLPLGLACSCTPPCLWLRNVAARCCTSSRNSSSDDASQPKVIPTRIAGRVNLSVASAFLATLQPAPDVLQFQFPFLHERPPPWGLSTPVSQSQVLACAISDGPLPEISCIVDI